MFGESGEKKQLSVKRFKAGDALTESHLNSIVQAVNEQRRMPGYGNHIQIAETIDDGTGYPPRGDEPNVYGFRFVYLSPESDTRLTEAGKVNLTADANATVVDGYLLNIPAAVGGKLAYIPENTLVVVSASTLGFYYTNYEDTRRNVVVYAVTEIDGRAGLTVGEGDCTVVDADTLSATGETVSVVNISETPVPASCYYLAHWCEDGRRWVIQPPAITDLRIEGNDLQHRRNCDWETWHTGEDCDGDDTSGGGSV